MFYKLLPSFFIIVAVICTIAGSGKSNDIAGIFNSGGVPDSVRNKNQKNQDNPVNQKGKNKKTDKTGKQKNNKLKADTIARDNSIEHDNNDVSPDSLKSILKRMGARDEKDTTGGKPDSISLKKTGKGLNADSGSSVQATMLDTLLRDSLFKKNDTIVKEVSPNAVDEPINYHASDSIRFEVASQKVYLYGNAYIKYKDIELKAAFIVLSLGEDVVYAKGVKDSTGREVGKPQFKQTGQEFDAVEMTYNFKTKKGLIRQIITKPEDGTILLSDRAKKFEDDIICIEHGKFSTCVLENPHFYIALTKAKVIPDKKIISGPAYLVIADIPMPLGIPFGFFPNKKGTQSGVLIPEYGEEQNRGFFLRNGGYYFAINDYVDLALTGDIYSNMSRGVNFSTNYKIRYKFNGKMNFKFNENFMGEKDDEGYQHNQLYAFTWQHFQDQKFRPNSTFSANVNASSSSFDRYNNYNYYSGNVFTNQKMSSISYSRLFPNTPFSFSTNLRHSQNSTDSSITLIVPDLNVNMSRIFPFRKKSREGKLQWWENIGISMTSTLQNKVVTKENKLFTDETVERFQNGVQHSLPLSTSFKILKYFSFSPTVAYNERWYFSSIEKMWDDTVTVAGGKGAVVIDTIKGFNRVYDYNFSTALGTTLYGMIQFRKGPVKAIRHVITPSVSFSYRPDFGEEKYGYYREFMDVRKQNNIPYDTIYRKYSRFENGMFGSPGYGKSGMIGLSLNNNLEMKVNTRDTIEPVKKVRIFDALGLSASYNLAADSMNWSPLNANISTNLFKMIDIRFNGGMDFYAVDSVSGMGWTRVNKYEWDETGKLGRITNGSISVGCNFAPGKKKKPVSGADPVAKATGNSKYRPDGYAVFRIPWTLNIAYNLRYDKPFLKEKVSQTLSVTGSFELTSKWRINVRTDYDFTNDKLANASVDIYRDLHCWEMSFNWVPFGFYKSYFFRISVKSSVLQDLKLERRKNWLDNLEQDNQ